MWIQGNVLLIHLTNLEKKMNVAGTDMCISYSY